jgi:zona occludens toxin (predicted ATPase)
VIAAIVGLAGSGKTMTLTRQASTYDVIICNYRLREQYFPKATKIYYVKDVEDFFTLNYMGLARAIAAQKHNNRVILSIDEAGLFFPSTAFKKMPTSFMYLFAQHRKLGVDMWYTAQSMRQVNALLKVNTMITYEMGHLASFFYFSVYDRDYIRRKGSLQWRGFYWARPTDKKRYTTLEMLDGADWYIRSTEEVKEQSQILRV